VSLQANELRARNEDRRDSPGDTLGFISENDQVAFRRLADARLVTTITDGTQLTTGVEFQHAGERNDGISQFATFPATSSTFDETRTNRAAYANLFVQPTTTVAVNAGARLDDNSAFGRFGTGRVGVTWEPVDALRLRGAWGTAYREPNFNETFSTTFSTGNPELAPEQARTWEFGANYAVFGLLQLGATWFDQRFTDLIQFVAAAPPAPNYENLASAAARGLELTWGLDRETSRIILNGSYTLLTTEVLEAGTGSAGTPGQELLRRPAHQATVNVGWRSPSVATVQLTAQFTGARRDRDFRLFPAVDVTLPSFWRHDLSVDVPLFERNGAGRLPGLTLRVENLGNVRFENVAGFRAPGRVVLVGVRHAFGG
jgi:vitamin B12 transporter